MSSETKDFRLDGIYVQRQEGFFMQRVKLPAGVISSRQARVVAAAAERFGRASLHLTTRGSIEIHWLKEDDLPNLKAELASVGLTSRGACGGAVRGITCGSSQDSPDFPKIEIMARRLQRHFAGNPRFERLPKKFKIGIEATTAGGRHLIQDVGLVRNSETDGRPAYDVWVAGGLGREPRPGFLLEKNVAEERIIPLIEAILRVYAADTPPGKRLKHLLLAIGEEELRRRIAADPASQEELPPYKGFPETQLTGHTDTGRVSAFFFAGSLTSAQLSLLADFAETWADGVFMVSSNQDLLFQLSAGRESQAAQAELERLGFASDPAKQVSCRICPGTHECRAGLSATREVAAAVAGVMGPEGRKLTWAVSGCHNACTQPQLADYGIVTARLQRGEDEQRIPLFDLYQAKGDGFGEKIETGLELADLLTVIERLG